MVSGGEGRVPGAGRGPQGARRGCALADRCALLLTWELERGQECARCPEACEDRAGAVRRGNHAAEALARYPEIGAGLKLTTEV